MKHIMLNKIDDRKILVNVAAIATIEVEGEESTWVELTNGTKFLVYDLAEDIIAMIGSLDIEGE